MVPVAGDSLQEWFAQFLVADLLEGSVPDGLAEAAALGIPAVLIHPTDVAAVPESIEAIAVVGYPSGRHHSLVKAAEARLAVQMGASAIVLSVDPTVEENSQLADIVTVRQAVPAPVVLYVDTESRDLALHAGAEGTLSSDLPRVHSAAEAVDAVDAGARRILSHSPAVLIAGLG